MGDAVPGLVVKISCQLPSIKLELVCIETRNAKKATFVIWTDLRVVLRGGRRRSGDAGLERRG